MRVANSTSAAAVDDVLPFPVFARDDERDDDECGEEKRGGYHGDDDGQLKTAEW